MPTITLLVNNKSLTLGEIVTEVPDAKSAGTIRLVEADLLPTLEVTYEGGVVTGYEIFLNVEKADGVRFKRQATITEDGDPTTLTPAAWFFEWEAGDLTPGIHKAEIELFDGPVGGPSTKNETWGGIRLLVDRELG
jgi:hypothetical protein